MANLLSYIPPFLGILLILAGIPAFTQLYKTTQDLNLSIILAVIYEIVVIIGGFLMKVWDKLVEKWADRLSERIDLSLLSRFSKFRKKYFEYIVYQHRVFDVKGLSTQGPYSLELERVYVQLGVNPTPAHEASPNPLYTLPTDLQSGNHSIWDFITNKNAQKNNYAVLGAPGSGKTTLLKHMALSLASTSKQRQKLDAPDLLPVLLFIRDHTLSIKDNQNISLAQLIRDQFKDRQAPVPPEGWLEQQIQAGNCLIMFDGLDEVADLSLRDIVVKWVDQCMASYGKNRFILSSRPFGYLSNPLTSVTVLQVRPFTHQQVEKFVQNWYLANEIMSFQKDDPGVREDARRGAVDLLERISSTSTLAELAVNPLLLTMISTVHRYRSSLPGRRVELYAEICEVFLGKRQQARGLQIDMTPAQKIAVLSQVACFMMFHNVREINKADALQIISKPLAAVSPSTTDEKFLENVVNSSGLLIELESGRYSFSHLTFQEYLTSLFLIEKRLENELLKRLGSPWWRETTRLYCAQTNASNVIDFCLQSSDINALSLAIECVEEAREVSPSVRTKYQEIMEKGVEDPDPKRRRLISSAWLKKRIQ